MTTLIIGAGFIGAYIARDVELLGDDVVCYDINPQTEFIGHVVTTKRMGRVTIVRGDVTDLSGLLRTIREYKVQRIVHLAGIHPAKTRENIALSLKVNVQGTSNVFEAAALADIEKVIWTSSTAVFGPRSEDSNGVIHNEALLDPTNLYGSCKAFNERLSVQYHNQYGVDITGLRLSAVYGWGKHLTTPPQGNALQWLSELIDNRGPQKGPIVVHYGDGQMDFLHIDDVARSVCLALDTRANSAASYIITGDLRPVRDAFVFARSLMPEIDLTLLDDMDTGFIRHSLIYDQSATQRDLGYSPEVTMEEGIRRSINLSRKYSGLPALS